MLETLDPGALLQYPLLAIVLGVVFWFINRSDKRDHEWHERQEKRDGAFLTSIETLTGAIRDLDTTIKMDRGGGGDG